MMVRSANRLAAEYVLPLRWQSDDELAELTDYLRRLSAEIDVTVVDGSRDDIFARHGGVWGSWVRHLRPEPWPGRNGKVAGVVTGVFAARHDRVVIADDDVRWDRAALEEALRLLHQADLIRPQNVFAPLPWHARWDTGRSLVNRAFGGDYPGTYAVRRSRFVDMGGYDGDVLFENLELARTVVAAGGTELVAPWLWVRRRPPTARHFWRQRIRQAYDDLAQPVRLLIEASLLPSLVVAGGLVYRSTHKVRELGMVLALAVGVPVAIAELGRRRHGGRSAYPATAALWAPVWLVERAICVWAALGIRIAGGIPYAGQRLIVAAHSVPHLRRALAARPPVREQSEQRVPSRTGSSTPG